jgi:hypothetical protein
MMIIGQQSVKHLVVAPAALLSTRAKLPEQGQHDNALPLHAPVPYQPPSASTLLGTPTLQTTGEGSGRACRPAHRRANGGAGG